LAEWDSDNFLTYALLYVQQKGPTTVSTDGLPEEITNYIAS